MSKLKLILASLVMTTFVGSAITTAQAPAPKAKVKAKAKVQAKVPPAWYKPPAVKKPLDERDPDTWPEYHVSEPGYYNRVYNHDDRPVPPYWYAAYRALRRVQLVPPDRVEHYSLIDAEVGKGEEFYRHPGWWLGIEQVQAREDGSLDILTNATPLLSARTVPVQIQPQYLETYRLDPDGTLKYLGGRPLHASPDGKAHLQYHGKPNP
jgi:hypothetical protein